MDKNQQYSIGVIGAGSWGTSLANMLSEKGLKVKLWVYEKELLKILVSTRCNSCYLPDTATLDPALEYTSDIEEAVSGKDMVLWVTPVKAFRTVFKQAVPFTAARTIHVSASKGIERETLKTVSMIAGEILSPTEIQKFTVLSGPSFAKEVSRKIPTAVVVASRDSASTRFVQQAMATPFFRTYATDDLIGAELGGALKNVIAVASGIADGLGFGHNTRAALVTRGLAEITRLGKFMGADPETFSGLSGIGDLMLTCTSCLSRNYSAGLEIGKGKNIDDIMKNMTMVVEGVYTAKAAFMLSVKSNIEMPIVSEIYNVLFKNKKPEDAVRDLMARDLKRETV